MTSITNDTENISDNTLIQNLSDAAQIDGNHTLSSPQGNKEMKLELVISNKGRSRRSS